MSTRTYVLLALCGASCLLTIISLISGQDVYLSALMHGPVWSLGLLGALVVASALIAYSNHLGVGICIGLALLMWLSVIIQRSIGVFHYGIVICVSLVVFLGMVWRDDFDFWPSKRSWRTPFWRSPD